MLGRLACNPLTYSILGRQFSLFCENFDFSGMKASVESFILRTPELFNYELSRNDAAKEVLHRVRGEHIYKAFRVGRKKVLLRHSGTAKGNIKVELLKSTLDRNEIVELKRMLRWQFDLNTDLSAFYKMARKEKILRQIIKKYEGLYLSRIPDLFETLCWAIIGQQINVAFAHDVKRALVESFGEAVNFKGEKYYLFPKPKQVLAVPERAWREMRFSRQKARYVQEVAKAFEDGLSLASLENLPYQKAMERLVQIIGVGTWTGNYALLRCCGLGDAFPVKDVALQRAFQIILRLDSKPNAESLLKYQKRWTPFCHYATLYLWRSLSD